MPAGTFFRILLLTLVFQACTISTFDKPLPDKSKVFHSFPRKMRGNWKASSISTDFPVTEFSVSKDSLRLFFAGSAKPSLLSIENDSVQFFRKKDFYGLNLLSEYGWLIYIVNLKKDVIEIQGFDKRSIQIVKNYEVEELPNKLTVIEYKPEKEEWDQILQYGLTPKSVFRRSQ